MPEHTYHIAYLCADRGIPVLGRKGASIHVRQFASALYKSGSEVKLITARKGSGNNKSINFDIIEVGLEDYLSSLRSQIAENAGNGTRHKALATEMQCLLMNAEFENQLQKLQRTWRIDLIYERYSLWNYSGIRFARDNNIPFILEVNSPLVKEQEEFRELCLEKTARAIENHIFSRADLIVSVSSQLRNYVTRQGASSEKVVVLPNAADLDLFAAPGKQKPEPPSEDEFLPPDKFVIGFIGSLKPWHGVEDLLEAFKILREKTNELHLLIVGDGPLREKLKSYLVQNRLDTSTTMVGDKPNELIPAYLRMMDVAAAPYPKIEDFYFSPLKIFEYMAAGVPIVASSEGQIKEVLEDQVTALLYPPGNIRELAAKIEQLWNNPELRKTLGQRAQHQAARYHTWEKRADQFLEIVKKFIPASRSS